MAAAPQISILVPIYNVERYLEQCLDSIVSQSFEDFEAICINDGSTDGSRSIVQRYLEADARFRVVDKENSVDEPGAPRRARRVRCHLGIR